MKDIIQAGRHTGQNQKDTQERERNDQSHPVRVRVRQVSLNSPPRLEAGNLEEVIQIHRVTIRTQARMFWRTMRMLINIETKRMKVMKIMKIMKMMKMMMRRMMYVFGQSPLAVC
jgi:hypothetical protein